MSWLPHPVLSALLTAAWLVLQQSVAPMQLIVAAALGLVLPRLVRAFLPPAGRLHAPAVATRLLLRVLRDIVVSNLVVTRLVLLPGRPLRPAWVELPLTLKSERAISLLATIITTTPGTVSCVIDEQRRVIHVHALDCDDPAALVADMNARYQAPLKEIFG
jgi:multicomponent K+:H+ antiporter subunit E